MLRSWSPFLLVALFAFQGCDGGGSRSVKGGGGASPPPGTPVPVYQPPAPLPASLARAELGPANAAQFLHAFVIALDPLFYLSYLPLESHWAPEVLNHELESPTADGAGVLCETGDWRIEDKTGASGGVVKIEFRDCRAGGYYLDGTLHYQVQIRGGAPISATMDMQEFVYGTPVDTFSFTASGVVATPSTLTATSFLVGSKQLSRTLALTRFELDSRHTTTARVSVADVGWVDLLYTHAQKRVELTGAGDTALQADYHMGFVDVSGQYILTHYELALSRPEGQLFSEMSGNDVAYWPYLRNEPAALRFTQPLQVMRGELLALGELEIKDPEGNLVDTAWRYVSGPEPCAVQLEQTDARHVDFTAACHGEHVLQLTADDGVNPPQQHTITVLVMPRPAQIGQLPSQLLGSEENLDQPVHAENSAQDGPFIYELFQRPNGVQISDAGIISGRPLSFMPGFHDTFELGVRQQGEPATATPMEVATVAAAPERSWYPAITHCDTHSRQWRDMDGDGLGELACRVHNSFAIVERSGHQYRVRYLETRLASDQSLQQVRQMDFDADGLDDVVLLYPSRLVVLKGSDLSVLSEQNLASQASFRFDSESQFLIDTDGSNYVALSGVDGALYWDVRAGLWRELNVSLADALAIVDLGGDGRLQVMNARGSIFDVQSHTSQQFGEHLLYADYDGDGRREVMAFEVTEPSATLGIFEVNYVAGSRRLLNSIALPPGHSEPLFVSVMDTDQDGDLELALSWTFGREVWTYDFVDGQYINANAVALPEGCYSEGVSVAESAGGVKTAHALFPSCYGETLQTLVGPLELAGPAGFIHGSAGRELHGVPGAAAGVVFSYQFTELEHTLGVQRVSEGGLDDVHYRLALGRNCFSNCAVPFFSATGELRSLLANAQDSTALRLIDPVTDAMLWEYSLAAQQTHTLHKFNAGSEQVLVAQEALRWLDIATGAVVAELASNDAFQSPQLLTIADLNADGRDELVVRGRSANRTDSIYVFSTTAGQFELIREFAVDSQFRIVAAQDVDDDGVNELIAVHRACGSRQGRPAQQLRVLDVVSGADSSIEVAQCVSGVLDLGSQALPKRNILAFGADLPADAYDPQLANAPRLFEIDANSGEIIWQSERLPGRPTSGSVVLLGDRAYDDAKLLMLDTGPFIVH